jgi:hypothetical protein
LDKEYVLEWLKDFGASLEKDFTRCFKTLCDEASP